MIYLFKKKQKKLLLTSDVEKIVTVKERHYWKFIKQILFLLNYILFIIKIRQMCKIKSHWMFSVVFFMFYICVICDCVCVLKYAIYLIWPRQFSFGPCFFNLAHTLARTKNEPEGTLDSFCSFCHAVAHLVIVFESCLSFLLSNIPCMKIQNYWNGDSQNIIFCLSRYCLNPVKRAGAHRHWAKKKQDRKDWKAKSYVTEEAKNKCCGFGHAI